MNNKPGVGTRLGRAANLFLLALFLFALVIQYNDPDPIPWMAVYGMAALACLLAFLGRLWWPPVALLGLAALVWAATLAVKVLGRQSLIDSEEGREMLGLLLVFAWMSYLAVDRRWRQRAGPRLT